MTENMHEWKIKRQGLGGHIVIRCEKSQEELTIDEAESRLNEYETLKAATERLSAGMAIVLANALDDIAVAWDGKDAGKGPRDLRAYADTLESK